MAASVLRRRTGNDRTHGFLHRFESVVQSTTAECYTCVGTRSFSDTRPFISFVPFLIIIEIAFGNYCLWVGHGDESTPPVACTHDTFHKQEDRFSMKFNELLNRDDSHSVRFCFDRLEYRSLINRFNVGLVVLFPCSTMLWLL